jgi:quercetin dioxygenase-like cupin family protein
VRPCCHEHVEEETVPRKALIAAAIAASVIAVSALAQQAGIKRTPLQKVDFPQGYTVVFGMAEIAPGICAGRHVHPGVEVGYVMEGSAVFKTDGQPDRAVKAGDSFQSVPGVPHDGCATGQGLKVISAYVVEKGKPLASPAP